MAHQSLLRHAPSYAAHEMGVILADMERRLVTLEQGRATSGMKNTSLEGTGMNVYDDSGTLRGSFGVQHDGTIASTSINNPEPPPAPIGLVVESILAGASVTYAGETASGAPLPSDFSHSNIYSARVANPTLWTLQGTVTPVPGSFIVSPLEYELYYIRITNVNLSGKESAPSEAITVEPSMVVGQDILDGAVTELKLAADSVTAAAIAAGAVGSAQVGAGAIQLVNLADGSVSASKIIDGAVEMNKVAASAIGVNQLAANSVVAGKIATDAIETRHLIAGAVQAGNIAANAIQAGHIVAQAITTEKIMTFAVTANEVAANAVTAAKLQAGVITASKLATDLVIATRIITGNPAGARAEMHPTLGLQAFTGSGVRTFWIDASTGNVNIIGSLQSGTGTDRIVIQDPADAVPSIFFYANPDPVKPSYINTINISGRNAIGINSGPSADSGTDPRQGSLILESGHIRLFMNGAPGNTAHGVNARTGGLVDIDNVAAHLAVTNASAQLQSWFEASNSFCAMRFYTAPGTSSANHITMNSTRTTIENLNTSGNRDGGFAWIGRGTQDTYFGMKNTFNDGYLWFAGGGGGADLTDYNGPVTINRVVTAGQAAKGWVTVGNSGILIENLNNDGNRDGGYVWAYRGTGDAVIGVNNSFVNSYLQIHGDGSRTTLMGPNNWYLEFNNNIDKVQLFGPSGTRLTLETDFGGQFLLGANNNNYIRGNAGGIEVVDNGIVKAFVIPHPTDEEKLLVHGCTESPNAGVEYWGEVTLDEGQDVVVVQLPDYFEELCAAEHRTVLLTEATEVTGTPKFVQLAAGPVLEGVFTIHASKPGPLKVNWLVKAHRKGVEFEVEPRKDEVQVSGWGPYLTTSLLGDRLQGGRPDRPDRPEHPDTPEHPVRGDADSAGKGRPEPKGPK